jgi:hypothetical protein
MMTPMAAKRVMVVGRATICPRACSRCERPKRVKSGMLSESVAQKPIMAVTLGTKTGQKLASVGNFPGSETTRPRPCARQMAQPTRRSVITRT